MSGTVDMNSFRILAYWLQESMYLIMLLILDQQLYNSGVTPSSCHSFPVLCQLSLHCLCFFSLFIYFVHMI